MYRVKIEIAGQAHEVGSLHPPDAFPGCDLAYLRNAGAVEWAATLQQPDPPPDPPIFPPAPPAVVVMNAAFDPAGDPAAREKVAVIKAEAEARLAAAADKAEAERKLAADKGKR